MFPRSTINSARSKDLRGSSTFKRNSIQNSTDFTEEQDSLAAKKLSEDNIFVAAGCLKGEECYETPKSIHRLFEENLATNSSHEMTALIYEGELGN